MSFSFGAKPGFGTPTAAAPGFGAQQPNLSFGTPTAQPSLFGTPTTQAGAGLSFGTPASSAPGTNLFGNANTTPSAGLNFGAPANANLSFGTPASAAPSFGTPGAAAPSFGTPGSVAPSFGAAAPSFGAPAASAPSFGAPAAAPPSFGTPASVGFGVAASSAPSFGAATSTPSTGISFGSAQGTAPKLGLSFGTPTTSVSTGLNFGAPASTATTNFSLGAPPTTSLTGGLLFGASATSTAPTLNFGAPTSTTSTGLNFGLGTATATSSTGLSFGFTSAVTSAPASVGLGGIASTTPSQNAASTKAEQTPKEQLLPNEIQQTVDNFKNFVKQQKAFSSDVARCSVKEFRKVEADIDAVNNLLNDVEKQLAMNKNVAEKLKYDTARGLQQVEMAQRTYDTPIGLQYENNAPLLFFIELVDNFEREMQNMKLQIENTDKFVKNVGKPTPLTSQDLAMGMRRIHEAFVSLAGRLQSVHSQVQSQKDQYLNFRKHMLNDSTNIFEASNKETNALNDALNIIQFQPPDIATGPTPFSTVSHPSVVQAAVQNNPPPAYGTTNTFGGFQTSGFGAPNSTLFGSSSFGQTFNSPSNSGFQLQKPPTGNKRGKQ